MDLHFPKAGIDRSLGFGKQPNRPVAGGTYARTCAVGTNVRGYEPSGDRARGGSRPGLTKYLGTQVAGTLFVVQQLAVIAGSGFDPPGGQVAQESQSGRVVTLVAVSQGNVFSVTTGGTAWVAATNQTSETPPLNYSGILFSAPNTQRLWFADGINYAYYDPRINAVRPWVASAGTLPVDSDNNTPRLICNWRGRIVLSGFIKDPQNWFMSRVNDPTDFDYSPESVDPTQPIAGNNAPQGLIGDVITGLIPYSDDVLIFLGDHTVYMMRGDPMAGGQIDLVSDVIGGAWGEAWAKDAVGNVYFFSNRPGIWSLVPGQAPVRISQAIESLIADVNTGENAIRLLWNDEQQGLHVFITPLEEPGLTTHFFWEQRSGAWWADVFARTAFDPLCCAVLDGNEADDRVCLIGSWDGYVRELNPDATTDDSKAIESEVVIGPLLTADLDELLLKDLQAILGTASGDVTFEVLVADTAERALTSTAVVSGTWRKGRNLNNLIRRAGHAVYVRITSDNPWAFESVRARIAGQGKVRRRGH